MLIHVLPDGFCLSIYEILNFILFGSRLSYAIDETLLIEMHIWHIKIHHSRYLIGKNFLTLIRKRPFNFKEGLGLLFFSEIFFSFPSDQSHFFLNLTLHYMGKLASEYFLLFASPEIYFFHKVGHQNIF